MKEKPLSSDYSNSLQALLARHYTGQYSRGEKHDSPEQSRINLIRRVVEMMQEDIVPGKRILDIGSGPQCLERQLLSPGRGNRTFMQSFEFVTVDQAQIPANRLLARNNSHVSHVRADGAKLPFADKSFGLIVSNHAIDFMDRGAFDEAFRVLKEGGYAVFNLHHASLTEGNDIDRQVQTKDLVAKPSKNRGGRRQLWTLLDELDVLFADERQIAQELEEKGFKINEIKLGKDKYNRWWEVVARKG